MSKNKAGALRCLLYFLRFALSLFLCCSLCCCDSNDVDDVFLEEDEDSVVSYSVAPAPGTKKGKCYVFLLNASTHELYFYATHKVSSGKKSGLTSADMTIISALKKK